MQVDDSVHCRNRGRLMKEYVKVLIADNRAIMRNLLLKILENEGYKVTLTSGLYDMFHNMRANSYDILLADMKLFADGKEAELTKAVNEFNDTSIIAMTGYGDADSVSKALACGANEYISKPFKSNEVSLIIERAYWRLISKRSNKNKTSKVTS
jgi:DNA-binding NtrC family response regulator